MGGIPDSGAGSLWPWSDDFSGEPKEFTDYRIFGVEQPHHGYSAHHRSFKTTLTCGPQAPFARPSFGVNPTADESNGSEGSPFPTQCPRCQNYRRLDGGREIIEPLRTRGPRSISVVMEDTLRVQPDIAGPNGTAGRKALVFSDSRQDAAQLAGDLRRDHRYDVFRQLLYRILHRCRGCGGSGFLREESAYVIGRETSLTEAVCDECGSLGDKRRRIPAEKARDILKLLKPIHALLHEAGDIAEGAHLWYTGLRPRSNGVRRCAVPSRASAGRLPGLMMQYPRRSAIIEWL